MWIKKLALYSFLFILVACGPQEPEAPPSPTPTITNTPFPTLTSRPATLTPTHTPTLRNSSTPAPTFTAVPSFTPIPPTFTIQPTAGIQGIGIPDAPLLDDFTDPESGWPSGGDELFEYGYFSGFYRIWNATLGGDVCVSRTRLFRDMVIDVDVTKVSGADDAYFGVTCRKDARGGVSNYYSLGITGEGRWQIGMVISDRYVTPWPMASGFSSAINRGNATNHITASCIDSILTISANGVLLGQVDDSTLEQNEYVGLIVGTRQTPGIEVLFDNFKAVGVGTSAPDPTETATP